MITVEKIFKIEEEIKSILANTFYELRSTSPQNYVAFLANADYCSYIKDYVIDNRMDKIRDKTRIDFLINYLNDYYSLIDEQPLLVKSEHQIHVELMIYSHLWESKSFLKRLYQLANIANSSDYNWKLEIPENSKHNYVRKIKQLFTNANNPLEFIIEKGFHSSLRNAFAHSDYSINFEQNCIILHNYKGKAWELQDIKLTDWSERFIYSTMLSYHFINLSIEQRRGLVEFFGTNIFKIKYPPSNYANIVYRQNFDNFIFE
ncbi:MAG: hypothetical protein ACK4R6_01705 [Spirosomataceae bacterium]